MEMIKVNHLTFNYPGKSAVLNEVNLSINSGEIILLKGASGSGKSTLASLLAGHQLPVKGEIIINGKKIIKPNREVFVVHQESDLFPWLTVRGNLELIHEIHLSVKNYLPLIEEFGLAEATESYPKQISGGMKRRLAIIRGLLINPKVLILDESMSSLDDKLKNEIMKILVRHVKDSGMTLIIIDHNDEILKTYTDRKIEI